VALNVQTEGAVTKRRLPAFLRTPRELMLFGGQGAPGATICAVAAALRLAIDSPARRFLCASFDRAHSLINGIADSSTLPNLDVRDIDPAESLRMFRQAHALHLRRLALRGPLDDDTELARLLEISVLGLGEVLALDEILSLVRSGVYASVIVSIPSSSCAARFLSLPDALRRWVEAADAIPAAHRFTTGMRHGI